MKKFTKDAAKALISEVEASMAAGYPLVGSRSQKSAVQDAAERTGVLIRTFRDRLGYAATKWDMRPVEKDEPVPEADISNQARDEIASLKHQLSMARAESNRQQKRAANLEEVRASIYGLMDPPLRPKFMRGEDIGEGGGRTVVLHLSDVHMGEVVDFDEMDGLNSFNADICEARVTRFFEKSAALMTDYWHGAAPERICLLLNGDMISGALHIDHETTDDLTPLGSVKRLAPVLAGGINHLVERVPGAMIDVYSTDGNHGRSTFGRPRSKKFAANSYDAMVTHMVEVMVGSQPNVSFRYASSPDILFDIYNRPILVTHGDRIGSRGGAGFQGPVATILRGFRRVQGDYSSRNVHLDKIFCGHFHTTSALGMGYSNGSVPGPSEYGLSGRMDMEPPQQTYVVFHSEKGAIEHRNILIGHPDEGSFCA